MATPDLERTAFTVECFLNALSLDDGPARTAVEEQLVCWLVRADPDIASNWLDASGR